MALLLKRSIMKYLFLLCSLIAYGASAQIWRYPPSPLPYGDEKNPESLSMRKGLKSQKILEVHYNGDGSEISRLVEYYEFDEQGNEVLSWESYTDSAGTNNGDTTRLTYNDRGFWDQAFLKGKRTAYRTFQYNAEGNVTEIRTIRKDTSVSRFTWGEKQRIVRVDYNPGNYTTWDYNPDGTLKLWQHFEKNQLENEMIFTHCPRIVEYIDRIYYEVWNERRSGETVSRGYFENGRVMKLEYYDTDSEGLKMFTSEYFYDQNGLLECLYDSYTKPDGAYRDSTWKQVRDSRNHPIETTVVNNGVLIIRVTYDNVER
jgi:hypothetical protein